MEACYGGTDVMERSCAVARGIDVNNCTECALELYLPQATGAVRYEMQETNTLTHPTITSGWNRREGLGHREEEAYQQKSFTLALALAHK